MILTTTADCSSRICFRFSFLLILSFIILTYIFSNTSVKMQNNRMDHTLYKQRLPECLIIGAYKAGTGALINFLRLHPDIKAADREIHFFNRHYDLGYEWYRKQMPYSLENQLTIEKSPGYFLNPPVPDLVRRFNSSIKLLLIVRSPVERSISGFVQMQGSKDYLKNITFEERVIDKTTGKIIENISPVWGSLYDILMEPWLKYFSLRHFYIVDGEKLVKDPYTEIRNIESFLGLKHSIPKNSFVFNKQKGFFCVRNNSNDRCLGPSKGRQHPKVDIKVISKLKNLFWNHNEAFFKMINRTFNWNK